MRRRCRRPRWSREADRDRLQLLMRSWYHTIDLPDGPTPGYFDTREAPRFVTWPEELTGGRCLDVGTFDGFWAFEMERRGAAEVHALDLDDPERLDWPYDSRRTGPEAVRSWGSERGPGFREAADALGSEARRVSKSVYDLDPDEDGTFDVVLCGALLIHLRDPVLALERMRAVCGGSFILVEALEPSLELLAPHVPAARFHPDPDQWWRVNSRGLYRLAHVAGFRVVRTGRRFLVPFGAGAPPGTRARFVSSVAAMSTRRGVLHRALLCRPRPPADAASG